jgi:hypothetical protein
MKTNQTPFLFIIFTLTMQLVACGIVTPAPTLTSSTPSITPSPINTITQTATAIPLPTCTPLPVTYIHVIDETVYNYVDAGIELGAKGAIEVLRQALADYHPEWAQEDDLAGYVWDHSNAQMIGVNPRVLLVTAGISLDWQIPNDHDMRDDIVKVGVTLTQHYRDFRFNEELQAAYPQVADAANYALYVFFDYDLEKLDAWQQEYDRMFGDVQPRILVEDCHIATQNN